MVESMRNWILTNSFELFGTISGLIYILLSIKQNIWLWPIGFISSGLSFIVFLQSKLYADMLLQVYYLVVSIYGFYHWFSFKNSKTEKTGLELPVVVLKPLHVIYFVSITVLLTLPCWYIFANYTDASAPLIDSFVSAGSIIATWMLARKVLEQWLWWIVIDAISVGIFFYKGLYFTVVLFVINTIVAIIGYLKWKKDLQLQ